MSSLLHLPLHLYLFLFPSLLYHYSFLLCLIPCLTSFLDPNYFSFFLSSFFPLSTLLSFGHPFLHPSPLLVSHSYHFSPLSPLPTPYSLLLSLLSSQPSPLPFSSLTSSFFHPLTSSFFILITSSPDHSSLLHLLSFFLLKCHPFPLSLSILFILLPPRLSSLSFPVLPFHSLCFSVLCFFLFWSVFPCSLVLVCMRASVQVFCEPP